MLNKIIIVLYFFLACVNNVLKSDNLGKNCFDGHIKYFYNGMEHNIAEKYCLFSPEENKFFLISSNCLNNRCEALQSHIRLIYMKELVHETGTPGFNLCYLLKGNPQIIEYTNSKKEWVKTNRCIFTDESFVEIDYLFFKFKKERKLIY